VPRAEMANSVRVQLGPGHHSGTLSASTALRELERYGHISRLDILPGNAAIVTFSDPRATDLAKAALGQNSIGAQPGAFTVNSFEALLAATETPVLPEVGSKDAVPKSAATSVAPGAAPAPVPPSAGPHKAPLPENAPPGPKAAVPLGAGPRKVHSFSLSALDWAALASHRERRRALHLRGLPPQLCAAGGLEALLDASGLIGSVEEVRLLPRTSVHRGLGCAVLRARSSEDVAVLARFFHGRRFGSGSPVAVSFAGPGQSAKSLPMRQPQAAATGGTAIGTHLTAVCRAGRAAESQAHSSPAWVEVARDCSGRQARGPDDSLSTSGDSGGRFSRATTGTSDGTPDETEVTVTRLPHPLVDPPPGLENYSRRRTLHT